MSETRQMQSDAPASLALPGLPLRCLCAKQDSIPFVLQRAAESAQRTSFEQVDRCTFSGELRAKRATVRRWPASDDRRNSSPGLLTLAPAQDRRAANLVTHELVKTRRLAATTWIGIAAF